jgi:hypothetical protein
MYIVLLYSPNFNYSIVLCVECGSALGMESKTIPDGNIRASSTRDQYHTAKEGRLNGQRAWCSGKEGFPYIEIDFIKPYRITSLATQGSTVDNKWVVSYSVKKVLARSTFHSYRENINERVRQTIYLKNRFLTSVWRFDLKSGGLR